MPKNKVKAKVLPKVYPFTKEEEKQLRERPLKDIKDVLKALDVWRKESLASTMRF